MMTRVRLRGLWFQLHKWIGLGFGVLLIALGLSGSVLVAHDWIAPARPRAVHAAPPPLPLAPSRYLEAAAATLPKGARPSQLSFPQAAGDPVRVRGFAPGRGPASVSLDAATAAPLASGGSGGFIMLMHRLHGSLLVPGVGRQIVGWLGVAMLISCLSGLWLWWPRGAFRRGFRWRRTPAFDANLHHMLGFWIALPLAFLSLTGAWIAFPSAFGALVGEAPPRRAAGFGGGASHAPHLGIDEAVARLSAQGALRDISLPAGKPAQWTATLADGPRLALGDRSGVIAPAERPQSGPILRFVRETHEGAASTGPIWRLVVFLGGLAPAALGLTGIIMWLRTRTWRGAVAVRKRARAMA